nr:GDP-mannose 4,6-dehydratase [Bradyrhizobium erythrophlei]
MSAGRFTEVLVSTGASVISFDLSSALVQRLFNEHSFTRVAHLAAESHVDRSIPDPDAFLQTNALGMFILHLAAIKIARLDNLDPRAELDVTNAGLMHLRSVHDATPSRLRSGVKRSATSSPVSIDS